MPQLFGNSRVNWLRVSFVTSLLSLTGCSSISWSSLYPMNWFASSVKISATGVGQINKMTPMKEQIIVAALDDRYYFRSGMQIEQGQLMSLFQGIKNDQEKIVIYGIEKGEVKRIEIMDEDIKTVWDTQIGIPFSQIYQNAVQGSCYPDPNQTNMLTINCVSPQSSHVIYRFTGKWSGPKNLVPSNDVLANWKVSGIIWSAQ
ncbi:RpoE-regulated lipoprotein [Arsenophonus nasoniae]|nr:RpoE-regulated lipoprotein [Arsenophonus nasoniae]WGM04608.1 RpoE-regulated lipoprotein [Arsenophonus nasoniae]WGM09720.1 RpoE-regulated lipoprotein [Arsenophonus nasoniae]WGM14439.1 RpoE-regulated lipoprotein [Arsenophonus nasoniae]